MLRVGNKIVWVLLFIYLAVINQVTGQYLEPTRGLTQYGLDVWNVDDGLPSNSILRLLQTKEGYLWIGTFNGLARFDGVNFSYLVDSEGVEMKGNGVWAMAEDTAGVLWVGTNGGGLVKVLNGKLKSYGIADGLLSGIIRSLLIDKQGRLWIGTGSGLCLMEADKINPYSNDSQLVDVSIEALLQDKEGNIWVGTDGKGLICIKTTGIQLFAEKEGLKSKVVLALEIDKTDTLWVGTKNGLYGYKNNTFNEWTTKSGLPDNQVNTIHLDPVGNLWVGTDNGLCRYRNGSFSNYPNGIGFLSQKIDHFLTDREGSLWIGTYRGGLHRLKQGKFITYSSTEGLSYNVVNAIVEEGNNKIWIGTDEGLNKVTLSPFKLEKLEHFTKERVRGICVGRDNAVWVATYEGLFKINGLQEKKYTEKEGLVNRFVRCVFEDKEGAIWIGTRKGLNKLKDNVFTTFTKAQGLLNDYIMCLNQDKNGNLLIGTEKGGLHLFKNDKFEKVYNSKNGLGSDIIFSVYEDKEGILWVCTNGGLGRIENEKVTNFTTKVGMPTDAIFQVLEDAGGDFWITSNSGVIRVSKKSLNDVANGNSQKINCLVYGKSDGMKSPECTGASTGCVDRDGKLWFPTLLGVAVLDPSKIQLNKNPPPVVLERVILDGKRFDSSNEMVLEANVKKLEFHYTGLSFLATNQVKFKIKLEGFDEDWIEAAKLREAYYTNLPPGDYVFKVKACNNDGIWNEEGIALRFTKKPHFYQTFWFWGLVVFGFISGSYGAYKLRVQHLIKQKQVLEQKVEDRTKEVVEQKTIIEQKNSTLERANIEIQHKNKEIEANLVELEARNEKLQTAYTEIEHQHIEIQDSILYAKRIQHAFLPDDEEIQKYLPEYFILYKPQHIVSGDFYWFSHHGDHLIVAAVDCTGHGVPGAFMSMMGNSFFHQVINERKIHDPVAILYELNEMIRSTLRQADETSESNDGMDVALCSYHLRERKMVYVGANRPLYIIRNKELTEIKPDKFGLGGRHFVDQKKFVSHCIDIQPGDVYYIFSDGYADQIGGPDDKKFMTKQLKQLLLDIHHFPMQEQMNMLDYKITNWQGKTFQLDDMLVIGTKFDIIPKYTIKN